ncbi:DUF4386 domain-containing protein [Fusibacter sp. JL216-2]|uniref:DUF4386 domain-containing protein n=1 Tax=Fusibacter sp. JL216-2 TaxID=3071453 RepID=UPI003D32B7F6
MTNTRTLNENTKKDRYWSGLISGISLIVMMFTAFFAFGYAHDTLFAVGDPALTRSNLINTSQLLREEIAAWGFIIILDIIVAWGFYTYLKASARKLATLSAILRLIYTAMLGFALLQLTSIQVQSLSSTSADLIYNRFVQFETIWSLGLIVFGAHLIATGFAAKKTPHIPRTLSALLVIAGLSYMVVHGLENFLPSLERVTSMLEIGLSLPMLIGEVGFGLWLLVKGKSL